jgi:diacylglycerol kinase family enzyme
VKFVVLHNPGAGDEAHAEHQICSAVADLGHQVVAYRNITVDGWEDVLDRPADVTMLVGGDGTVREVFIAIVQRDHALRRPVAIVPAGTANNVARTLRLSGDDLGAAIRSWFTGPPLFYDVPSVRHRGQQPPTDRLDAAVVLAELMLHLASHDPAGDAGVDDAVETARHVLDRVDATEWRLEIDGRVRTGAYLAVEAAVSRFLGPGLDLVPCNKVGDGRVAVVAVQERDRAALEDYLARLTVRPDASPPGFATFVAKHVRLTPLRPAATHVDDRPASAAAESLEITPDGTVVTVLTGGPSS